MLSELRSALADKNITFKYSQSAVQYIAKNSYSRKYGARNMRRFIRSHVEDPLAEKIIADYSKSISGVALGYSKKDDKLTVECI